MYPKMNAKRLSGTELIIDENGQTVSNVQDFWSWAYSDLISKHIIVCMTALP